MGLGLRPSKRGTQRGEEEWDTPAWSVVGMSEAMDKGEKDFPSNLTQASFKCISDRGSLCGDLNENGLHRLRGSGTIRRCDIVGGTMSLGVGWEVSKAQAWHSLSSCCHLWI